MIRQTTIGLCILALALGAASGPAGAATFSGGQPKFSSATATSEETTLITAFKKMPGLTVDFTPSAGGVIAITFCGEVKSSVELRVKFDSLNVAPSIVRAADGSGNWQTHCFTWFKGGVTAAPHSVHVRWRNPHAPAGMGVVRARSLTVRHK